MTPATRRFSICVSLALAAHAGLLAAVTRVQLTPEAPPEHFLTVTLNTGPRAQTSHSRTLSQQAQQGHAAHSRRAHPPRQTNHAHVGNAAHSQPDKRAAERVQQPAAQARQLLAMRTTPPGTAAASTHNTARPTRTRSAQADPRAAYLTRWRRQVEAYGNRHYPAQRLINKAPRQRLTLGITLRADGSVHSVRVLRSSGSTALDRAARAMVRNAGPYAAFPPTLRQANKRLTFAYEWVFASATGS